MKKLWVLAILILVCNIAFAEQFVGHHFVAKLPSKPNITKTTKDKYTYVWIYQGSYKKGKNINVSFSIDSGKISKNLTKDISEASIAKEIIAIVMTSAGSEAKVIASEELDKNKTQGGVGFEVWYASNFGIFVSKIIITKPGIWVYNILGQGRTLEEIKFMKTCVDSFRISKYSELAMKLE